MRIEWDVPIAMDDGVVLSANVFRPDDDGEYPVILSHGVYGKDLPIERFRHRLFALAQVLPDRLKGADLADAVVPGSDAPVDPDDYRAWEVVDPSVWVPAGYACVRVDARGSGRSEGILDPMSPRETRDYAAVIEWAGTQPWSNGRVGLNGKSYYAMTQWLVAAERPKHLAAICVWHGLSDWYRDATRHGGILYEFWEKFWYPNLVLPVQHGARNGFNPHSRLGITGDSEVSDAELMANRVDLPGEIRRRPLDDADYYGARTPQLERITVPLLAAADWSDHDLHLAGTIRGFLQASSRDKWLEIHAGGQFDDDDAVALQLRFFDRFLKDDPDDWASQPRVQLALRDADGATTRRDAGTWPLSGTEWRKLHLDLQSMELRDQAPEFAAQREYDAVGSGLVLRSVPFEAETSIIGPLSATLQLSSTTADADLFLTVNAIRPDGSRVELRDHRMGLSPASVGWLRASHRAIDESRSFVGRPFHTHDTPEPLDPSEIYEVEVELRPTGLVLPAGSRLELTISGHEQGHDDPIDRPAAIFANRITLYSGAERSSTLTVPIVGPSRGAC